MARVRKINWLLLGLVLAVGAWPGYTLLKGQMFYTRKLAGANPSSYVFDSSAVDVRNAIDASLGSASAAEESYGSWIPSGTDRHVAAENEYDLHCSEPSESYFWLGKPLEYKADFKVLLTPVSESKTRVEVQTSESMVRIGANFGFHGGSYYERVAPTTIEEYRILLKIGAALGARDMPELRLPA